MLFTPEEIKFIRNAETSIVECMNDVLQGINKELPSNITERLSALHNKVRNIHSDDREQNEMKGIIARSLSNLQAIKIEKMNSNKDYLKSQTMLFHGMNELDREQIIKIKHQLTVLSTAQKTCDTFVRGMQVIDQGVHKTGEGIAYGVNATKQGMSAAATAAKRGAGIVGGGIVSGAKKTGRGAISVGKGIAGGAVIVGGGVAYGAQTAWEKILAPAGTAVAEAIDRAITAMQDAVRRENIHDANQAIRNVVEQAQLVIDNSLMAIENALHILEPSLSPKELTDKAKKFIEYDNIERSLIAIIDDVIELQEGVLSSDQAKEYINYFNNKLNDVQTAVNSVVETADSYLDDARQELQQNFKSQQDEWLLEDFKKYPPLSDLKQWITNIPSDTTDQELYSEEHFLDIMNMLNAAKILCKQKNNEVYFKKLHDIKEELDLIFQARLERSVFIEKLDEAIDNIAEFDSLQYALERNDKFAPFLEKAQHFLIKAQESQENMTKPLKKAINALKAANSFAAGVLRLGEKGLNYVLSNIKDTINSIWDSITKIINSVPGLAASAASKVGDAASTAVGKLLELADVVTSKISELSDNFVQSMQKIIGIRKVKENKNAIYQHQAFQPDKIREVIQDNLFVNNLFKDSNPVEDIITPEPDKKKLYPYKVTTKLKCIDYKRGNKEIFYDVDLMVVYKDSIHFSPELDINHFTQKGYIVPIDEIDKFEDAKLELIKILGNDERGLLSTPRAESIKIKYFNDTSMNAFLDTLVMEKNAKKIHIKTSSVSSKVLKEFEKRKKEEAIGKKRHASYSSLEGLESRKEDAFRVGSQALKKQTPISTEDVRVVVNPLPKRGR